MDAKIHRDHQLEIMVEQDGPQQLRVTWSGKSTARDPGRFILPILTDVLKRAEADDLPLVIDFSRMEYLNSSTITPIIRILERARRGAHRITVLYSQALKWQALSFTALDVFCTDDGRIEIAGI